VPARFNPDHLNTRIVEERILEQADGVRKAERTDEQIRKKILILQKISRETQ